MNFYIVNLYNKKHYLSKILSTYEKKRIEVSENMKIVVPGFLAIYAFKQNNVEESNLCLMHILFELRS